MISITATGYVEGADTEGRQLHSRPTLQQIDQKDILPRFKRLTRSITVSIMTDCVHSRNEPDSWTAHDNSACDLRGIWSRPVSDPGLSVVTKHPSGSTNSA